MTALVIQSCGPMTSLQDRGRFGLQRFGVSNSGAMDALALTAANTLVGNEPGEAVIEFTLLGGIVTVEGGVARVAIAGAERPVSLDHEPIQGDRTITIEPGQRLVIGAATRGVFFYLAVAGGLSVEPQLGSVSLHPRAGIGGLGGRPLREGDRLRLRRDDQPSGPDLMLDLGLIQPEASVRVVLGPQDDAFTEEGVATFLGETYRVSPQADRMGFRLQGPRIAHARGYNIVSDGIVSGSVQVPGSGEPIVLMADRQTTGGYPKIATVISADLRVLAQRRPGDAVRFVEVGVEEARSLALARHSLAASLPGRIRAVRKGALSAEDLLGLNLAGDAVDALDERTG